MALRIACASLIVTTAFGCKNFVHRSQSPDSIALPLSEEKKLTTDYVGDTCVINGLNFAAIEGVGLAVALRGTGSNPRPCNQRDFLVQELESKKQDITIEPLLAGTDTELVLMKGMLPPGIRKGEKFDIEVGTLKNTESTSLENGMVMQTRMRPMANVGKSVKMGHVVALGKGRVLVDAIFESRTDQPNKMHGYILGGGVAMADRRIGLAIKKSDQSPQTTIMIARAINSRFTFVDKNGRQGVAEPKTDRLVEIVVPDEYKLNIGRYLQVVINTAHSETVNERLERMEVLAVAMLDPSQSALTSVRLEALGNDGLPILKRAVRHQDLEVKFQAAQALAYMGESDGVDHLKFVAKTEPAFRWHAMAALASLRDPEASEALAELMHVKSAETRYGAFRALRSASPEDSLVTGKWMGDFYLHRIPSETADPMIHFSRKKRPEIVIFGENQIVHDRFLFVESRMTIRSTGSGTVSITRFSSERGEERQVCSNRVGDLIETLARSGVGYGDLLKMFRAAQSHGDLSSRLVVNATPRLGRSYIADESAEKPNSDTPGDSAMDSPVMSDSEANSSTFTRMTRWFTKE